MPTKIEKDAVTGTDTTGHEWDGIKELNTPLPKWWLYVFYASIIWSLGYYVLYPAIPFLNSHTPGLLGYTARGELTETLKEAKAEQAVFLDQINKLSVEEIASNSQLLTFARAGGKATFNENCVVCHGFGGAGDVNDYPKLVDDAWLWGGTLDDIQTTITHGIRWTDDEDTRISDMPVFGDDYLEKADINNVAEYVLSLSGQSEDPAAAKAGAVVFASECTACHGEDGRGLQEVGGPNLADSIWLYGGSKDDLVAQISNPRHGVMPAWGSRLSSETIKMLTVYVHSLGGGQ